jgi:hypothetical protein
MRGRIVVVAVLVAGAVLPSCTGSRQAESNPPRKRSATGVERAKVAPGRATTVALESGVRVQIAKGGVDGPGTLTVRPLTGAETPASPEGMVRIALPVDIELTGARLTGPAKVVLPVDVAVGRGALQMAYDEGTRTWVPENGRYDPGRRLLVTDVSHFSIRDWFSIDLGWAKEFAKKLLLGKFGDQIADVPKISCGNEDWPPTGGWKLSSSSDPRITWCLDRTGDSRTLRVRDGTRFAVMASGPATLGYTRPVLPVSLASPFLKFEEVLNNSAGKRRYTILRRRDDLAVDLGGLQDGSTAKLEFEPNMTAYLADLFDIEVDMVAALLQKVPTALLPKALEGLKDPKALLESASAAKCLVGAFNASDLTLDAQRASDPIDVAAKAAQCALEGVKAAAGLPGFLIGALVSVLSIPGNLVGTFIAGGSAAFGGLDYTITISAPTGFASILDRRQVPGDCVVRYLDFYASRADMGGDFDNLAWIVPWDEVPGSGVGHSGTVDDVVVALRGGDGKLHRSTLDALSDFLAGDPPDRRFVMCGGPGDGIYRIEHAPPKRSLGGPGDVLTTAGLGPVRIGDTYAQAETATGFPLQVHYPMLGDGDSCIDATLGDPDVGIGLLGGDGVVRRIDISGSSTVRTKSGIGIGSTEADVKAAYAGNLEVEGHPYDENGHYLTYRPSDTPDRLVIFETDGQRVTSFRVGTAEFASYIEHCA